MGSSSGGGGGAGFYQFFICPLVQLADLQVYREIFPVFFSSGCINVYLTQLSDRNDVRSLSVELLLIYGSTLFM